VTAPSGARYWSATLAAVLDEVAGRIDAVSRQLSDAWPDARGDEWVHRLRDLRSAVQRDADAAVEFGRAVDRLAGPAADGPRLDGSQFGGPLPGGPQFGGPPPGGPQLGGTGAARVDDRRGVTIPRLNDPTGG
jgi:hypothetical protein